MCTGVLIDRVEIGHSISVYIFISNNSTSSLESLTTRCSEFRKTKKRVSNLVPSIVQNYRLHDAYRHAISLAGYKNNCKRNRNAGGRAPGVFCALPRTFNLAVNPSIYFSYIDFCHWFCRKLPTICMMNSL